MNENEYLHNARDVFDRFRIYLRQKYIHLRKYTTYSYWMGADESPEDRDLALVIRIIAAATLDSLNRPDAVFIFSSVAICAVPMSFLLYLFNPWSWLQHRRIYLAQLQDEY